MKSSQSLFSKVYEQSQAAGAAGQAGPQSAADQGAANSNPDANSAEAEPNCKNNIIDIMADKRDEENIGGTLRLGLYPAALKKGTKTREAYDDQDVIQERHRHRFEFNNKYRDAFEKAGMVFSGVSPDNRLVEIIELPKKKFFIAAQYHPEFLSRPQRPEGLFKSFIGAASGLPAEKF